MSITRNVPPPIEHYGLIGDCRTAALVARDGSIDWLCWPRFDSGACFAALLGNAENGRFHIGPAIGGDASIRRYQGSTMVLESVFETDGRSAALIDFMVPRAEFGTLVRIVEGRTGTTKMRLELALRFNYGQTIPWVTKREGANGIVAISGPDMVVLRTDVRLHGEEMFTAADFEVHEGERIAFVLTHCASHLKLPPSYDPLDALYQTTQFWTGWCSKCVYDGPWENEVRRSLLTLKCLTFEETGGIVAAPTTSLPEDLGGVRNWDYRFCWLRDATLTLFAFMQAGHWDEANAWASWLRRSAAGRPDQIQIMYGIAGERRLDEWQMDALEGYQGAKPVRIGNAASDQLQLDVYGEVCNALSQARRGKLVDDDQAWPLQRAMLQHLKTIWMQPDNGMWETRGGRQHFTFSKVMAWVAFERSIEDAEKLSLEAPLDEWRATRDEIHRTICVEGFNAELNSFTQAFGSKALDATLLLLPIVEFLPASDPRITGTIAAIERGLMKDGFVLRYRTDNHDDGLTGGEGAFLACSFWLVSAMHRQGRVDEANTKFGELVSLCNDLGLLSEEYDPTSRRFTGNFPQAFSHVALVTAAMTLAGVHPRLN